jgi:hypothetical protein
MPLNTYIGKPQVKIIKQEKNRIYYQNLNASTSPVSFSLIWKNTIRLFSPKVQATSDADQNEDLVKAMRHLITQ